MGMLDKRLAALGTDYVNLFFIHSFGDNHTLDDAIAMVKSKELKQASEAAKKSGKARLVGISTHHKDRAALIQAAAEGGIVNVIMLQYRPWLDKDSALNKAIDAAHERGIGLISMKQIAGNYLGDKPQGSILDDVVRRVPVLAEKKLTPYQGLLHAIWTDERLSAVCTTMRNTDHIRENTDAAVRTSRSSRRTSASFATRPWPTAPCSAPIATADVRSRRGPGPSWATSRGS